MLITVETYRRFTTFNLHFQEPLNLTVGCFLERIIRKLAFNLHFQEPLNLTPLPLHQQCRERRNFQSPFSGAFESYELVEEKPLSQVLLFQSPFSGAFESYGSGGHSPPDLRWNFQSPFSGAFESYAPWGDSVQVFRIHIFQSPFSGAFESYSYVIPWMYENPALLSISIFRSLWILRKNCVYSVVCSNLNFQSPFSGAFESYLPLDKKNANGWGILSISIFRSLWILHTDDREVPWRGAERFQSPFSGAFESYRIVLWLYLWSSYLLSISIFRSLWILLRNEGRIPFNS